MVDAVLRGAHAPESLVLLSRVGFIPVPRPVRLTLVVLLLAMSSNAAEAPPVVQLPGELSLSAAIAAGDARAVSDAAESAIAAGASPAAWPCP